MKTLELILKAWWWWNVPFVYSLEYFALVQFFKDSIPLYWVKCYGAQLYQPAECATCYVVKIFTTILSVFVLSNSSVHCTLSLRSVENLEYGMLLRCTSLEYCWFFKNSCSENCLFVSFSFLFSFFFFKTLITICRIWTSWAL